MHFRYSYVSRVAMMAMIICCSAIHGFAQKTLFIDKQEYSCANNFNIGVRTLHMSNVVTLQGTIQWDTSVLKYSGISFGTTGIVLGAGDVNVAAANTGTLTFLWFDNNLQGRTSPDSAALFTIQFNTNGSNKGKGLIHFADSPTVLEIDTLGAGDIPVPDSTASFADGYVVTPSTYQFVGSGNWSLAANWLGDAVPPATLPPCSEIVVNPSASNTCVLDVSQTLQSGSKLTIVTGKKMLVTGSILTP